jgi:hypothetical protein
LNVIHILKVAKQTPCERPGACWTRCSVVVCWDLWTAEQEQRNRDQMIAGHITRFKFTCGVTSHRCMWHCCHVWNLAFVEYFLFPMRLVKMSWESLTSFINKKVRYAFPHHIHIMRLQIVWFSIDSMK